MAYSIQRLSLSDMDRAAAVLRIAFDTALPWLSGLHTPEEDRAFFRGHVFVNDAVWGAVDGEIIGIIAFRDGWVDQLYVLPDRQREGVGKALLQVAKSTWPSLKLWTFQKNLAARAFYESQGFAPEKTTDGSGNEEREPDVLYTWSLTA